MIRIEYLEEEVPVYDVTVEDNSNFFANDILVHNCSEIVLLPDGLCNLSEAVIRSSDKPEDIIRKVRIAAILGTYQSTLTNFKYVSKRWKDNAEDERLLGVSLTGIMDNKLTSGKNGKDKLIEVLTEARKEVIKTNLALSESMGINSSVACTAVKPSGTVSSLVDSAAGIHGRHARHYLRTVRASKNDPLSKVMIDSGLYHEEDVMKPEVDWVFYFPMKSPKTSVLRDDMSAIEQLETWMLYQKYWCEHKPSVTISVKEDEWFKVGAWVYENFEWVSGISFLPASDHVYEQAPYQEITEEEYDEWLKKTPKEIDWGRLSEYEKTDMTVGSQELSCSSAEGCSI